MAANPDEIASQKPTLREKYDNYIGGEWVAPVDGGYFEDTSPIDGSVLAKISQSNEKDVDQTPLCLRAGTFNLINFLSNCFLKLL
jgi:hypothetical protein